MMMSHESCSRARRSSGPLSTLLARGVKPHRLSCLRINSQSFSLSSTTRTRNGGPPLEGAGVSDFTPDSIQGSVGTAEEAPGERVLSGLLVRADSSACPRAELDWDG